MSKICGLECEVWSRVVGYMRPVSNFNLGKQEEFKERRVYNLGNPYSIFDNEKRYLESLHIPGGIERLDQIKRHRNAIKIPA